MDYDAIIVGGGPAGLAAAAQLAQAPCRVLLLDRESFGGQVMNVEWIDDYPRPGGRVPGPKLAGELVEEAGKRGVEMELGEVVEVESYSGCKSVTCADGKAYTASVVIVAGGLRPKKLGVPGEDRLQGKGVIHCAFCDAGLYADQVVAVCGGGDAGIIEAAYLAKHASKVYVIEAQSRLSAVPELQARAKANSKLEIRCGQKVVEILGDEGVTGVQVEVLATGRRERLDVYGVLARVGFEPATDYLESLLPVDDRGRIAVNGELESGMGGVFAAGDIRSGSPRGAAAAVSDGKTAAASARRFLQTR